MRYVLFFLAAVGLAQQQSLTLTSPAPAAVTAVSASYSGSPGANTYYYWVIANYTIGQVPAAGPGVVTNVGTLSGSNVVSIGWAPTSGASTYDVLRTTTATRPSGTCSCALATGLTTSSTTDTGAGLSSYTLAGVPAASAVIQVDNQSATAPFINVNLVNTAYRMALISSFTAGQCAYYNANGTLGSFACGSGSGSVTSVSFTGGIISVATPTTTPALTIAGTSGGIPYFSGASTWESSGALTANLPVIGGGAGVAPSVGTRSGNTTQYVTTTGAQTSGRCVTIDASGNHIADSAACNATTISNYYTNTTGTGIGPTTFTPDTAKTLTVMDATAVTGKSVLALRLGAGNVNGDGILQLYDNAGSLLISAMQYSSSTGSVLFRGRQFQEPNVSGNTLDPSGLGLSNTSILGWAAGAGFNAKDTGVSRCAAGITCAGTGAAGAFDGTVKATNVQTAVVAVGSLPACNAGNEGMRAGVNDSNAVSFTAGIGAVVAAGGSTHVPVYCDGTNWRIG